MAKKIVHLSEAEFMSMINEAVAKALQTNRVTDVEVSNVSKSSTYDIKLDAVDKVINPSKKQGICAGEEEHSLMNFKGKTFKFFGEDSMGIVSNILFTFEKITKLSQDKTILFGTVSYNQQSIIGDKIIINFDKGTVKYKENGSRYQYSLEIDNRMKPQWDAFLERLKELNEGRNNT